MDSIDTYREIYKNVFGMLNKRGYLTDEVKETDIISSFKEKQFEYQANKDSLITKIIFIFNSKIKPNGIREILNNILENHSPEELDSIIFVISLKIPNSIHRIMNDSKYKEINIQFFSSKELIIDITEHSLNPKFVLISDKEVKELADKYMIENKLMLPQMLQSDPISKFYNFKPGSVCKIIRKSPTNINSTSYRIIK